jgi:hypothetical protein
MGVSPPLAGSGSPLQVLGIAHAIPVGFPLRSLTQRQTATLRMFLIRNVATITLSLSILNPTRNPGNDYRKKITAKPEKLNKRSIK